MEAATPPPAHCTFISVPRSPTALAAAPRTTQPPILSTRFSGGSQRREPRVEIHAARLERPPRLARPPADRRAARSVPPDGGPRREAVVARQGVDEQPLEGVERGRASARKHEALGVLRPAEERLERGVELAEGVGGAVGCDAQRLTGGAAGPEPRGLLGGGRLSCEADSPVLREGEVLGASARRFQRIERGCRNFESIQCFVTPLDDDLVVHPECQEPV